MATDSSCATVEIKYDAGFHGLTSLLSTPGASSHMLQYLNVKEYTRLERANKELCRLLRSEKLWRLFYLSSCPFYTVHNKKVAPMLGWKAMWRAHVETGWKLSAEPDLCGDCLTITHFDEKANAKLRKRDSATNTSFDVATQAVLTTATFNPEKVLQLALTQQGVWRGRHCFQVRIDHTGWGAAIGVCKRHEDVPYPHGSFLQLKQDGSVGLYRGTRVEKYPPERKYRQRYKANLVSGDIVTLMLNLNKGTLSFYVNARHWATVTGVTHENSRPRTIEDLKQQFVDIKGANGETRAKILLSNHKSSRKMALQRFQTMVTDSRVSMTERGASNAAHDHFNEFGYDHIGCILYDCGFHRESLVYLRREAKQPEMCGARLRLALYYINTGDVRRENPADETAAAAGDGNAVDGEDSDEAVQREAENLNPIVIAADHQATNADDGKVYVGKEELACIEEVRAYVRGAGAAADFHARTKCLFEAASEGKEGGPSRYYTDLSMIYRRGIGVKKDNAQAVAYYRKSAAYQTAIREFKVHTEPLLVLAGLYGEQARKYKEAKQAIVCTPEQLAEDARHALTLDDPFHFFVAFNCTQGNKQAKMRYSVLKPNNRWRLASPQMARQPSLS